MNKKDLCECGRIKDIRSKHCQECYSKNINGINNPNYRHGETLKKHYCSCGKELNDYRIIMCLKCKAKNQEISMQGSNNPNYKKGKPKCIDCGKELNSFYAKRCWNCYVKWSQIPENNANYVDGKGRFPYPLGWTDTYKEQIRFRDNYKCQICGCHEVENCRKLDVHHIDYDKENLDKNNLISLCLRCHLKTNFDRVYWYELLKEKMCGYLKDIEIKI